MTTVIAPHPVIVPHPISVPHVTPHIAPSAHPAAPHVSAPHVSAPHVEPHTTIMNPAHPLSPANPVWIATRMPKSHHTETVGPPAPSSGEETAQHSVALFAFGVVAVVALLFLFWRRA